MTELCPNCDRQIEPPGSQGGRPRRWCSAGCQRSGEAKMRRLHQVLKRLERDRAWYLVHGRSNAYTEKIDAQIAVEQQKFDHLAGVPERTS